MEEQPPVSQGFPAPPPFWQDFTPENIERIASLRAAQAPDAKDDPAISLPPRILDLPAELRYLQPPQPPADGKYRCFASPYDINEPLPTLQEMGIQQLYTPPASPSSLTRTHEDRGLTLKRIAKSLLLNFLEFIDILSINPGDYQEKLEDLRTLFINFHHLLNEYRPHQAREQLILMMHDQLVVSRKETREMREVKERVEGVLEGLGRAKLSDGEVGLEGEGEDVDDGKEVWDELEMEFGA